MDSTTKRISTERKCVIRDVVVAYAKAIDSEVIEGNFPAFSCRARYV
jgi:hypothetical protein